jgi:hypothetical protein
VDFVYSLNARHKIWRALIKKIKILERLLPN